MKIIVEVSTQVVAFVGQSVEVVENGYDVGGVIFPNNGQYAVYEVDSVPEDAGTYKTCYDVDKGFYANPNYVAPQEDLHREVERLKALLDANNIKY